MQLNKNTRNINRPNMNILFIANPSSGKTDKQITEEIISELAIQYKFTWETYYTEKQDTTEKLRKKISELNPDLVIAAGGDGTINLVGKVLQNSKTELGIIPAGSANGLAYNLGMPGDFKEALNKILQSKARSFDAIRINEDYLCLHLSDVGINAQTVKRFEQENSKGMMGYGKHMLKELLSKKKAFSFHLTTNGTKKKYTAEMLIVANAKAYGTGAIINPPGKTDDGKFEIIIIKPYPWWSLFRLVRLIFVGKHHQLDYVKVISTQKADIHFSKPQDLQADGEMIEAISVLQTEILPSALKIRY
jgi:diacylglycerol kinase (ATP)